MRSERRYCDDCGEETLHRTVRVGPDPRVEWRCQPCRVGVEIEMFRGDSA